MARFAILRHDAPRGLHFDLLLEMGSALKAWAMPQPPGPDEMMCEALPDHRFVYLDYEGPVSGERGSVGRWDAGTYQTLRRSDYELVVRLAGERLVGRVVLERTAEDPQQWRFSYTAE
ncbi:MAG TPA: DNA polymerase ligase N-terminal domain-containing protein [Thermoguttaceae bacterium]|nr:DNA polymerase ligase N-terminal domain-containing protein [Thermoguttaceae bacterium]